MYDLQFSDLCELHQEAVTQQAAAARQMHDLRHPSLSLRARLLPALGDLLIRLGQRLKETPRRLEAEPASLSFLTIIL